MSEGYADQSKEQPVGTGFSQGMPTATNEDMVAEQFAGFWKKCPPHSGFSMQQQY